jgi:hypothetical protein
LKRDEFLARVEATIEDATNRIVAVALAEQQRLFGGFR